MVRWVAKGGRGVSGPLDPHPLLSPAFPSRGSPPPPPPFRVQVRKVLELVRPDRQTLMFSATWPTQVRRLASEFLRNAATIQIGKLSAANTNIKQNVIVIPEVTVPLARLPPHP